MILFLKRRDIILTNDSKTITKKYIATNEIEFEQRWMMIEAVFSPYSTNFVSEGRSFGIFHFFR